MNNPETSKTKVILDNEQAKTKLKEITAELLKVKEARDAMMKGSPEAKEADRQIRSLNKQAQQLRQQFEKKIDVIINGQVANATLKDLAQAARKVSAEFSKTDDPQRRQELAASYQRINGQIREQNELLRGTSAQSNTLKSIWKEVGAVAATAFAVHNLFAFGKAAFKEFAEAERGVTLLKNQIVIANGESTEAFQKLNEQADQLSGLFEDDDIRQVQLYFAQYGLGSEQIQRIMPTVIDFAAATGQSLDDAAKKVIQATNGQSRSMKEYGVVVEDTGSKSKNLENIVLSLTEKFEGQAEIVGGTTVGAWERLKTKWKEFQEDVGTDLINLLETINKGMKRVFNPDEYFSDNLKQKLMEQQQGINDSLSALDSKAVEEKITRDKAALEATKKEKNKVLLEEYSASKAARLKLIYDDIQYYEASVSLSEKALKRKVSDEKKTNEDLTAEGLRQLNKIKENREKFEQETSELVKQANALRAEAVKDESEREIAILTDKYEKEKQLLEKQRVVKPKGVTLTDDEATRNVAVNYAKLALDEKYLREKNDLYKKYDDKILNRQMKEGLQSLEELYTEEKQKLVDNLSDKKITEEEFQIQSEELELHNLFLKIQHLKNYAKHDEKAKQELLQAQNQFNDLLIKKDKSRIKEQLDVDKEKQALQLGLAQDGSKEQLDLRIKAVEQERDAKLQLYKEDAEMRKLVEADANKEIEKLRADHLSALLLKISQYVKKYGADLANMWSSLNRIAENKSNARLANEKKNLDKEREFAKWQLDHKLIDQAGYDAKIKGLDEKQAKEERKIQRESAIRAKKLALFNAYITMASAVLAGLATQPFWPVGIAMGVLAGIMGGLQIAAINSEPIPEAGKGDYTSRILKGPKHSSPSKGMPVVDPESGNTVMLLEGNEIVGSSNFVDKNPELSDAIVEASQKHDGDLSQVLPYYNYSPPTVNATRIVETNRMMQNGGYVSQSTVSSQQQPVSSSTQPQYAVMMESYKHALDKNNELMEKLHRKLDKGINASLDFKAYQRDKTRYEAIQSNR